MKIKITYILIAVLTVLGGLNIFQSLKNKLLPPAEKMVPVIEQSDFNRSTTKTHLQGKIMTDERFKVAPGDLLKVQVSHADLQITTGDSRQAHIVITLEGDDMARAEELFQKMSFQVTQDGKTVMVHAERLNGNLWSWNDWGGVQITVHATIPAIFDTDIETTHGDVELGSLDGFVKVGTSHGDVDAEALSGPQIIVHTTHGDVEVHSLKSDEVSVATSHGDIELGTVVAREFTARTSHADIEVAHIEGRANITNSHGDIDVYLPKTTSSYLKTSHGDIEVEIDAKQGLDVSLNGGRVKVDDQLKFSGNLEDDRADGQLNGGGPRLEARASHGSITVREQ